MACSVNCPDRPMEQKTPEEVTDHALKMVVDSPLFELLIIPDFAKGDAKCFLFTHV